MPTRKGISEGDPADDENALDDLERRARRIRAVRDSAESLHAELQSLRAEVRAERRRASTEADEDHRGSSAIGAPLPNELRLYDMSDTCAILGVSKAMLYRLVTLKQIHPLKIGRRSVFDAEEIERFINVLRDERTAGRDSPKSGSEMDLQ